MSDRPQLGDLVADVLAAGLLFLETYATLGSKSKDASRRRAKIIKSQLGAGGNWRKPWGTLDHVESQLLHARSLITKGYVPGDYVLWTDDEKAVVDAIYTALDAIGRIKA